MVWSLSLASLARSVRVNNVEQYHGYLSEHKVEQWFVTNKLELRLANLLLIGLVGFMSLQVYFAKLSSSWQVQCQLS